MQVLALDDLFQFQSLDVVKYIELEAVPPPHFEIYMLSLNIKIGPSVFCLDFRFKALGISGLQVHDHFSLEHQTQLAFKLREFSLKACIFPELDAVVTAYDDLHEGRVVDDV